MDADISSFTVLYTACSERIDSIAERTQSLYCGNAQNGAIGAWVVAAERLLANADRWNDDSVYSRDLIDLAMQRADRPLLHAACGTAEAAYGDAVRRSLTRAVESLQRRPGRLEECMDALSITTVTKAQLWQAIRKLGRVLPGS